MATKLWRENNKELLRKYRREWYERNKVHAKARTKLRKKELRSWLNGIKKSLKCIKCGESHPSCVEFHHVDPKAKELVLARVVNNGWSKEKIKKEMEKCVVLCSNCHRKTHYKGA